MYERTRFGTTPHSQKVVQDSDANNTTAGRLFKSGSEKPVNWDCPLVAESGAWCNDLGCRWHKGELR